MKKNKTKTIATLIAQKLIMHLIILLLAVWVFTKFTGIILEKYFNNHPVVLASSVDDIEELSEEQLEELKTEIIVFDKDFNIITRRGSNIIKQNSFTGIQVAQILSNSLKDQNFYATFTTVADTTDKENFILIAEDNVNFSDYSGSNAIIAYLWANLVGNALIVIVVILLFVRSVYKPLKANFVTIENSVGKNILTTSKVDEGLVTLSEAKSVLQTYNQMIEAINVQTAEKEKALNQNRQLISNLAHDLKSPITVLKGYSELLADGNLPPESQKEYISYIGKSAGDLNNLVTLLFEQIKYKSGDNFIFEKRDINGILRDVCANYYMIFDKSGFEFDSEVSEESYILNIDAVNIKRVFTNLLQNILNHNHRPTKVMVSSMIFENGILIKIKDDGVGIGEENREKVFDAFYQEDSSRNSSNSGIGLYIAKQIIEKHGGTITLTSEPGYKTVFTIRLKQENF